MGVPYCLSCSLPLSLFSVAPIQPGRQGLLVTGPDSITVLTYSLPRVYVFFLFAVGVLSWWWWWYSSTSLRNCISVRYCRTRSLSARRVWSLFLIYFRQFGHCHSVSDTSLCEAGLFVLLEALLYIQQQSNGSKESLSSLMIVTDVESQSLVQSAIREVLHIVPDNPVNFLQVVWMPHARSVLTGKHCLCYIP